MKYFFIAFALATMMAVSPANAAPKEITIAVNIDERADFRVFFKKGHEFVTVPAANKFKPVWQKREKINVRITTFPYDLVRSADQYCVALATGWIVHDKNGKAFSVSCDTFRSAQWADKSGPHHYNMKVLRGQPD